jgi:hypothetical protein
MRGFRSQLVLLTIVRSWDALNDITAKLRSETPAGIVRTMGRVETGGLTVPYCLSRFRPFQGESCRGLPLLTLTGSLLGWG